MRLFVSTKTFLDDMGMLDSFETFRDRESGSDMDIVWGGQPKCEYGVRRDQRVFVWCWEGGGLHSRRG